MTPDDIGHDLASEAALRGHYPEVTEIATRKVLRALDRHCRDFIALSPFLCLGTCDRHGKADVSPRGDAPGFVCVLDDRTLLIPDRRGNNRLDSLTNVVDNPAVGLLFLVPGVEETLRINGRGRIVDDPTLLAASAVDGKAPATGLLVTVEEAFLHCAKALKRSRLWSGDYRVQRDRYPTAGRVFKDHSGIARSAEENEAFIQENYRTKLY
ncbi:MAG: pyridoxamine 5'-phosphate oxidase family protein [Alphaproteobacteria bacterium]|nr:pyridoxamine 5'-phosphate oxidase family protein [Alphaproteobacteria bacterium]